MGVNDNDVNFGEVLMSVMSLLESSVTGNLLNNQPVDGMLYRCHHNLTNALVKYLNNSEPTGDQGNAAKAELERYVLNKSRIFDRKYSLDPTEENKAVTR